MKLKLSIVFICTLFSASAQDSSNYHFSLRLFGSTYYSYSGSKKTDLDLSKQPNRHGTFVGLQAGLVRKIKNFRPAFSLGYYYYNTHVMVHDSVKDVYPFAGGYSSYITGTYGQRLDRHVAYAQLSGGMRYYIIKNYSIEWNAGIRCNSQLTGYTQIDSSLTENSVNYTHSLHNKLLNYATWHASLDFYVPGKNSALFVGYTGGFSYYMVFFNFGIHHSFPLKKKTKTGLVETET
jgi:hypothetical protein